MVNTVDDFIQEIAAGAAVPVVLRVCRSVVKKVMDSHSAKTGSNHREVLSVSNAIKVETVQFIPDFAEKCEAPLKREIIFQTSVFVFYLSFGSTYTVERSDMFITYGPGVIQARNAQLIMPHTIHPGRSFC